MDESSPKYFSTELTTLMLEIFTIQLKELIRREFHGNLDNAPLFIHRLEMDLHKLQLVIEQDIPCTNPEHDHHRDLITMSVSIDRCFKALDDAFHIYPTNPVEALRIYSRILLPSLKWKYPLLDKVTEESS